MIKNSMQHKYFNISLSDSGDRPPVSDRLSGVSILLNTRSERNERN